MKQQKKASYLFADNIRRLTEKEIQALKNQGNSAEDWAKIKVVKEFKPDFIQYNMFRGICVLGKFNGKEKEIDQNVIHANGLYSNTFINCEIGNNCLIKNNGILANYIIKQNAIVHQTKSITAKPDCTFGNGLPICLGMETGEREILTFAEITIPIAEQLTKQRKDKILLKEYESFIKKYIQGIGFNHGIIENHSIVLNSGKIVDTYIGTYVLIDNATFIYNTTLLGDHEEETAISHGVYIENSCIQWGCKVTSMALVRDSVLTEHSHVERHGKVTASIIGPNTGIAEGEVTSCLLGPFTGFHHQALLIAAIWPQGKGNMAYGANVGSNHTSRAADQEIFCGEGLFFGLGTNIKFPADYTAAPYSIIATGVNTLPQKVEFPFSLINNPGKYYPDIPPMFNEIIPAWLLSDNIYTIMRNQEKYKKRNKARRTAFDFDIFRTDIIDQILVARDRLQNIDQKKDIYTGKDIPGLGKNFLLEKNRPKAIQAYNLYIEYYCLCGLRDHILRLMQNKPQKHINCIYTEQTDNEPWEHQRNIIAKEDYNKRNPQQNLQRLIDILEHIARQTYKSKTKDDIRGKKIISDYDTTYTKADNDAFIITTRKQTEKAKKDIEEIIKKLADI